LSNILKEILATKATEVASAKARRALAEVETAARAQPPARDFAAALAKQARPRIIAECKRQSPSRGVMLKDYRPVELARAYEAGGAAAISVLTDEPYFGGKLPDLTAVRDAVKIPVMRKDFIIDAYQIFEARAAGADSFLLLAGVLDAKALEALLAVGRSLGMEPLVESHTAEELDLALGTSARLVGVNNRNLKDFSLDLETSRRLLAKGLARTQPPGPPVMVCESGIKSREDLTRMAGAGYHVFLIGEGLATQADPAATLRGWLDPTG
jgi:indole-3-glycerol phosphate synthase